MTGLAAATGPAATGAAGSNPSEVPTGTRDEVLAWVGDDAGRAQQAYDAEVASASPRTTLLAELEKRGAVA